MQVSIFHFENVSLYFCNEMENVHLRLKQSMSLPDNFLQRSSATANDRRAFFSR